MSKKAKQKRKGNVPNPPTGGKGRNNRPSPQRSLVSKISSANNNNSMSAQTLCSLKYLLAQIDPFHPLAAGACVPDAQGKPSYKLRSYTSATIKCAGAGQVLGWKSLISPTNNGSMFFYTDGSSAINTWPDSYTSSTNGVGFAVDSKIPFETSDLEGGVLEWRLVGGGFRVRPLTALLNRGGAIFQYTLLDGAATSADEVISMKSYNGVRIQSGTADKEEDLQVITLSRTGASDAYTANPTYLNHTGGHANCFGYMPSLAAGDQLLVEWCGHFEYIGSKVASFASANSVDPVGHAAANKAVADARSFDAHSDRANYIETALHSFATTMNAAERAIVNSGRVITTGAALGTMLGYGSARARARLRDREL